MKTFNIDLDNIFKGLTPTIITDTSKPMLEECHNIVPIDNGYELHSIITDMNANGVSWGGEGSFLGDTDIDTINDI